MRGAVPVTAARLARSAWGGTPMTVPAGVPVVSLEALAGGMDLAALPRVEPEAEPVASGQRLGPSIPGSGLIATAAGPVDPVLIEALNRVQKMSALAVVAGPAARYGQIVTKQAEEIRAELLEQAQRQVDKLTIEIVGMLFDRIAQDKHLPEPIKELLRELQFPMMKVALVDPELFTKPDQPARQLMDRIASTAVGWTPEGEDNERYYTEVKKAIYTVLSEIEDGLGAFERALETFERYLAEERTRDDDPVARAKKALADAETREIMAINAMIKIRGAFEGVQVESYLREFLLNTWSRVLAAVWHKDKGDEKRMQKFLDAVPDLVWSVQPKINPDDRKRLITSIPSVLTMVREGLALIELPEAEQQEFFSKLMNSHAQAVKALELAHGIGVPKFEREEMRGKLEGITLAARLPVDNDAVVIEVPPNIARSALVSAHAAGDVDVLADSRARPLSSIPANGPAGPDDGADTYTDVEIDVEVRRWRRGDWFDLTFDGRTERVRLRWISPQRSFYLFQPSDGGRAHSLPLDVLRQYVRRGSLRLVGQAPLFERLVNGLMADLRPTRPDAETLGGGESLPPGSSTFGDADPSRPAAH